MSVRSKQWPLTKLITEQLSVSPNNFAVYIAQTLMDTSVDTLLAE